MSFDDIQYTVKKSSGTSIKKRDKLYFETWEGSGEKKIKHVDEGRHDVIFCLK